MKEEWVRRIFHDSTLVVPKVEKSKKISSFILPTFFPPFFLHLRQK